MPCTRHSDELVIRDFYEDKCGRALERFHCLAYFRLVNRTRSDTLVGMNLDSRAESFARHRAFV